MGIGADRKWDACLAELASTEEVRAATDRFEGRGLETRISEQEACCHALQDKVYVTAPDVPLGLWEFYTVLDENPANGMPTPDGEACCGEGSTDGNACCVPA